MIEPLINNDAVVLGLLLSVIASVLITSNSENLFWKKFYKFCPPLLLCYFIPSILNSFNIISGKTSNLYFISSRYLLPTSLVLLTLSVDFPEIKKLGSKAIIMFCTGTIGIIAGGPLSVLIVSKLSPSLIHDLNMSEVGNGLVTIAGSWIGGGANQAAMKEIFNVQNDIFSIMIAVDVIIANIWMAILLYGVGINKNIDELLGADSSAINKLKRKVEEYRVQIARIPTTVDTIKIISVGFGITSIAHMGSDIITPLILTNAPSLAKFSLTSSFFWLIVISSSIAVLISFTSLRHLEGVGASSMGNIFIYILVATIGMKMNIASIFENSGLFIIGFIWMTFHALLLMAVAKLIKAPFFFIAVGSQANVGGAASAPIVASAFHPSLAPVGVLLAVFGYAIGTYGAWICGIFIQNMLS